MKWVIVILSLIIPIPAFAMGIVPLESPLIETGSTSPRFEGVGGISIGVDDPEGDFRFNPAKSAFLDNSIFYSYPSISILENKQKDYYTGDNSGHSYESDYTIISAVPELGALFLSQNKLFYGFRTNYEFAYTYIVDKSSSTYNSITSSHFDRTKQINHSIPLSFLIGKKAEKISIALEAGAEYKSTESDTAGDEIYMPGSQKFSGVDVWIKPGILVYAEDDMRFSMFFETNVYSDGKLSIKEEGVSDVDMAIESYNTEIEKFNGEIDFIKDFEKFSFGGLFGFFSDKIKLSISESGFTSSISFARKDGFVFGIGVSSKITPTTLIGSDVLYSHFNSDLPAGVLPLNEYITFSKIEDDNIQWKSGIEQRLGENYSLRFGYILVWNEYESHYSDYEESYGSKGNKFIYNAVTSGFSYNKGNVRFDYLLRFNNIFTIVNSEIVNTFGIVVKI